jgi:ParB-like chromosome segregation protein Spo0J
VTINRNIECAMGPYQTQDPLSDEDFAILERDILERGVLVPIEFDEHGNVLDGHHRLKICRKHGITDYPTVVRKGWTEQQKRTHSRKMNLARRHMTREQRQANIEAELKDNPELSNRAIATATGTSDKTVAAVRKRLAERAEIPQVESRVGKDGKSYVRRAEAPQDANGHEVPTVLHAVFSQTGEYQTALNQLMEIRRRIEKLCNTSPAMRANREALRTYLERLQSAIQANVPHAVHSDCDGQGCDDCDGLGFTTAGAETPQPQSRASRKPKP